MDAVEILLLIYLAATCIVLVLLLFCWDNAVKLADHAASFCWTVLARCISTRAQRKVERWLDLLDDHVFNHSLQASYVTLVIILYRVYAVNVFPFLQLNPWVTEVHIVLSRVSVGICAALFIAACTSDPGTVTAGNVAAHNKLYPCNDRLWPKKFCKTCKFYRPARSKHCRVCRVCVARYDHHCAWINNCVGLGNMRIFLAFLAANASVTGYAAVIGCLALGGRLKAMGVLGHARVLDWRTGHVVMIRPHSIRTQLRYALGMSPIAAACTIFLALASLLLFTFLAYQLLMIAQGCTQYESDRRFSVHESSSRRAKQQAAPATSDGKSEREKVGRGGFKQTAPYVFLIGGIRWVLSCGKGGRGIKKHERVFHGIREPNMRGYDLDFVHNLRPWAALQQAEAQLLSSKQQEQQDKREKHE